MQGQHVTCNEKGAWLWEDANDPSQSGHENSFFTITGISQDVHI